MQPVVLALVILAVVAALMVVIVLVRPTSLSLRRDRELDPPAWDESDAKKHD